MGGSAHGGPGARSGPGSRAHLETPAALQVDYFNNATIVDLVERPHRGVLAMLDEACSAAGTITDRIFLQSLDTHHRHHAHYTSRQVLLCPLRPPPPHLSPAGPCLSPTGTVLPVLVGPWWPGLPSRTVFCANPCPVP